uniref:Uncharacterized protein LOC111114003 n=1 Tax=Crassostrea virginica TaxID=6565 RepID=A0A8B8BYT7_CRAVI|nr:uncharacterized protein LOC111114003 [Crassostrea virginica]
MAFTNDKKVWMGGESKELKLFDLQGELQHTVHISDIGMYICMHTNNVLFTDHQDKTVKKISEDTVVTMFTTGDWNPKGITGTASDDLLVCLLKEDQSKVVRYSSTGTVLQKIQYDSHCRPLYQHALYIAENVNGDIIINDYVKNKVIAVDRLGIFRYSYSVTSHTAVITSVTYHTVVFTLGTPHTVVFTLVTSHTVVFTLGTPHTVVFTLVTSHTVVFTLVTPHTAVNTSSHPSHSSEYL